MEPKMVQGQSEFGKMLYSFVAKTGKRLAKKYGMSTSGAGGAAREDGIWLMSIAFDRHGDPICEAEARKLIISCVNDFLEAVNKDETLKPFLKNYPFTAKNLELRIFNYDKDHVLHYFLTLRTGNGIWVETKPHTR
jgi:hypothetical protein